MEKEIVKVGTRYLCHQPGFSWFFVGKAVSKKERKVQLEIVKCHPNDRVNLTENHPLVSVHYSELVEEA